MLVKLNIFRDTASMLSRFLIKFQSDASSVPFLSDCLEDLMRSMLKKFVIREVTNKANTAFQLLKVDVTTNQLPAASAEVLSSGAFKQDLQDGIKKNYAIMLRNIVLKMQERSPLKYKLVRSASSLSPVNMVNDPEFSRNNFDKLVNAIHHKKRITSQQVYNAKEQSEDLVVVQNATKFKNFDMKVNRLDEFVWKLFNWHQIHWSVVHLYIYIYTHTHTLSLMAKHKPREVSMWILVENLQEKSLKAQRIVYDCDWWPKYWRYRDHIKNDSKL